MNRVVITGIGWITPMGLSIEEVWPRPLAGESGIARTTLFDATTFPTSISAEVKGFDLADHITDLDRHQTSGRNTRFALAACSQAWKQSGLNRDTLDLDRVGIYLGSGEGPIDVQSYTKTAIASWMPNEKVVNIPIWAGEAHRLMSPVAESEQEPNIRRSRIWPS